MNINHTTKNAEQINIGYRKEFEGIVNPTRIQIDPTLTKSGYAADAKVTGMVVNLAAAEADRASDEADRAERAASQASAAYKPLNELWEVTGTTFDFCEDVKNDEEAVTGMVYVGKVYFQDLPDWLSQAECVIEIVSNDLANGKAIDLTISSGDTPPYHWEYNYVMINGTYTGTGWHSYILLPQESPQEDGKYMLVAQVSGGNISYQWEKI